MLWSNLWQSLPAQRSGVTAASCLVQHGSHSPLWLLCMENCGQLNSTEFKFHLILMHFSEYGVHNKENKSEIYYTVSINI